MADADGWAAWNPRWRRAVLFNDATLFQEFEIMGELTDKIKGNLNEAAGKIKQQSNDPETRDEGAAQELKGKGEQFAGKVKGALGDDI